MVAADGRAKLLVSLHCSGKKASHFPNGPNRISDDKSREQPQGAKAEGKAEGGAVVLLKQLDKLCGPLAADVQQRIHRLSIEQLAALCVALLDFHSLADLQSWRADNENGKGCYTFRLPV